VPSVAISDWPALRYRGLSVDISRGPILTEARMEELIRTAAEFKLNILSFYMEHVFPYRHTPLLAPAGGEFPPDLAQRLSAYARRHHIELVPQQQTFGHLHHMLKFERYAELAEVLHGFVITPESAGTYEWILEVARQLTA
jgi:N-acetyl-beta-hexosaminidase